MYGMVVNSVLMAEIQAKNMLQQADDNLDDSEIIYLNYKQAEKTLVTVAQSNMIAYAKGQLQLEQGEVASFTGSKCHSQHSYQAGQRSRHPGGGAECPGGFE